MNDYWLPNLFPIVAMLIFFASLARRISRGSARARTPRPASPSRSSIVPTPRPAAAPAPAPAPAAARPSRRRLSEAVAAAQPAPAPTPRTTLKPAMGDMLSAEAAAAFPVLDLSLGDDALPGSAPVKRRAARGFGGAPIGSRGWGPGAIVTAEILGTPVGLRPGATVGVPHAF